MKKVHFLRINDCEKEKISFPSHLPIEHLLSHQKRYEPLIRILLTGRISINDIFLKGSPHPISGPFEPLCRVLFTFPSLYFFSIGLSELFSFSGDLPAY
jgi:hypothetical protein